MLNRNSASLISTNTKYNAILSNKEIKESELMAINKLAEDCKRIDESSLEYSCLKEIPSIHIIFIL